MELSRCSLNSMTVPRLDFEQLVEVAARAGIPAIAPWREVTRAYGIRRARDLVERAGLAVTSLCRAGMFTSETAAGRQEAVDDCRLAIDEAHELGAPVLPLVCGPVVDKNPRGSRAMIRDGIERIIEHAAQASVVLGIEPLHPMLAGDRSIITSLAEANGICGSIDHPNLGVVIDAYNVWFDPDLDDEMMRSPCVGLQLADWVVPIRNHTAARGMPGDGCIDLSGFVHRAKENGYLGPIEVEVISERWAAEDPERVVQLVVERFTAL
ncbi:sugar phosphate isomerase/epimerase [Pseudonocardia kunmingensis]|uniref:Sugar phosphate isomerase/epimerase n=2 Tax=Pseudonocardia kunmingensis TaxID=630975 RepID=A0A543DVJ6_9PSEU|nr:sugar phosphate isomerase/epimerase [Pseudonocardia kunmingensis]